MAAAWLWMTAPWFCSDAQMWDYIEASLAGRDKHPYLTVTLPLFTLGLGSSRELRMLNREFLHLQSGQREKENSVSVSHCFFSINRLWRLIILVCMYLSWKGSKHVLLMCNLFPFSHDRLVSTSHWTIVI